MKNSVAESILESDREAAVVLQIDHRVVKFSFDTSLEVSVLGFVHPSVVQDLHAQLSKIGHLQTNTWTFSLLLLDRLCLLKLLDFFRVSRMQ